MLLQNNCIKLVIISESTYFQIPTFSFGSTTGNVLEHTFRIPGAFRKRPPGHLWHRFCQQPKGLLIPLWPGIFLLASPMRKSGSACWIVKLWSNKR